MNPRNFCWQCWRNVSGDSGHPNALMSLPNKGKHFCIQQDVRVPPPHATISSATPNPPKIVWGSLCCWRATQPTRNSGCCHGRIFERNSALLRPLWESCTRFNFTLSHRSYATRSFAFNSEQQCIVLCSAGRTKGTEIPNPDRRGFGWNRCVRRKSCV